MMITSEVLSQIWRSIRRCNFYLILFFIFYLILCRKIEIMKTVKFLGKLFFKLKFL